ncbi:hypothetical protein [Ardenticatena maritima]|uniref:hypothetical protein n=1 Tax=Ardenticatena maritima TaxID=872965 RepID=UPI00128FBDDC|nr:hypothetical protein [Ardenticatena maritima]
MQKTIKVLYIAGSGRSGSTILGQLLGEIDGFVNLGEVRYLFNERMQKRNLPCSCGATPEMCEFWARYINSIPRELCLWSTKRLRLLTLPNLMLGSQLTGQANLKEFLNVVEKLYFEMARDTGARVFIDTSKHPVFWRRR